MPTNFEKEQKRNKENKDAKALADLKKKVKALEKELLKEGCDWFTVQRDLRNAENKIERITNPLPRCKTVIGNYSIRTAGVVFNSGINQ